MSERVPREEVEAMYRAYADGMSMREVGRRFGRCSEGVGKLFRRHGLPTISRPRTYGVAERVRLGDAQSAAAPSYDREYIAECIAMAAAESGDDSLAEVRYGELARQYGLPSQARVVQVFGSWTAAATAAGLRPNPRGRGTYKRAFSYEDVLAAVRLCAAELGHPPAATEYEVWQRAARPPGASHGTRGPYPSATLARQRAPKGRWSMVLADALGTDA